MTKEENLYEIGYLLKSDLKDEELLAFSNELKEEISKKSGLVLSEGRNKRENLSYPISKETTAFFNWIKFNLPKTDVIKEISSHLEKQTSVLRFLTIKSSEEEKIKPFTPRTFIKKPRLDSNKIEKEETTITKKSEPIKEKVKEEEIDKKIEELLGK